MLEPSPLVTHVRTCACYPSRLQIRDSRGARATRAAEASKSFLGLKTSIDRSTASLAADEELLQTLLTGLTSASANSAEGGAEASGGYMGQIAQARAGLSSATTTAEQAKVAIDHAEHELKALGPKAAKAAKEGEGLGRELEAARARKAELEKVLDKLGGDEQREKELLRRKADVSQRINELLQVSRVVSLSSHLTQD